MRCFTEEGEHDSLTQGHWATADALANGDISDEFMREMEGVVEESDDESDDDIGRGGAG